MVKRDEDHCYICGESVPQRPTTTVRSQPVSGLTNAMFLASLAFTAYCFFGQHKLSLPVTLAISFSLLLIRFLAERSADKNSN
jgi:hypothetical protein